MKKGEAGYIAGQRKKNIILTAGMYLLAVGIYFLGYFTLHTNKSLWTVFAVLSILPASKNAVRMIMFLRFRPPEQDFYRETGENAGALPVLYDLLFTTYEKTYAAWALAYAGGNICVFSPGAKEDATKLSKHIEQVVSGLRDEYSVKVYTEQDAFMKRLSELREHFENGEAAEPVIFDPIRAVVL
ncbi:MAG: hypothetical protein K6G83_12240 [Lachnospiraceae bacterium]|nr:hypothetical protein [Lachnospiraceae bacterium]